MADISETRVERQPIGTDQDNVYDLIIIGAGPAGMSAAIYAARGRIRTLLLEKAMPGGQVSNIWKIENYIGFPQGILGTELTKRMEAHLSEFKVEKAWGYVSEIENMAAAIKCVKTDIGAKYYTRSVIIASGLEPKKLNIPGEQRFRGRGVSYLATLDGHNYVGQTVAVIGGTSEAAESALYLARFARKVIMIYPQSELQVVMMLKEKLMQKSEIIDCMANSVIEEIIGEAGVTDIQIRNRSTDQIRVLQCSGIFVNIGKNPENRFLTKQVSLDEEGFVVCDAYNRTSVDGVFAAGDVRSKYLRQIATAVADGALAAVMVDKYLNR